MAAEPILTYFEGRGKGEIIRMTFCFAKIPFKDNYVHTREEFQQLKRDGRLLFGQVPIVEMDGMLMTQTNSIVRYIGGKANLAPKDPKDLFRMDMLFEGARDFFFDFLYFGLGLMGTDDEVRVRMKRNLDKYLPIFDKELEKNGTGYLIGSSPTLADISLLEVVLATVDFFGEETFNGFNFVQKFLATMRSLPEVVHYMSDVRHRQNDERYRTEVKNMVLP